MTPEQIEAKRERARRETLAALAEGAPPGAPVRELARREGIRLARPRAGSAAPSSPAAPVPAGSIGWQVRIATPNPLNGSQGRTAGAQQGRAARRKAQRAASRRAALEALRGVEQVLPCTILLRRAAWTRGMDRDGLEAALKGVRDGIADALGCPDDSDPRITWAPYAQRRGARGEKAVDVVWAPRRGA